ncbi:FxDxF family PEP-CTERM protein [Ideonella sp. DXS22W]|uniref:FxDxF family PEP-CTERM protein n=1 Tax=Pseudaquabacterium inlustre TaxID=2984192 RepID=A0ABU9CH11_9BURK
MTLAGVFGPGQSPILMGDLTDKAGVLINQHVGATDPFSDLFLFTVTQRSLGVASIVLPNPPTLTGPTSDLAAIAAIAFVSVAPDNTPTLLGIDTTASDGFTLPALLPQAGLYGLVVVGVSAGGNGAYLGVLGSTPLPVPEPASPLMLMAGLLAFGVHRGLRRR